LLLNQVIDHVIAEGPRLGVIFETLRGYQIPVDRDLGLKGETITQV
jgi:hypothetical protein